MTSEHLDIIRHAGLIGVERDSQMKPGRYSQLVLNELVSKFWWLIAIILLAALAMLWIDWRWSAAICLLALVVYPGLLMIAFYRHALIPEAAKSVLPQRARFAPDGSLTITYLSAPDTPPHFPIHIPSSQILSVTPSKNTLILKTLPLPFLEIPFTSPQPSTINK